MKILTDKADFSKENATLKNYQQVKISTFIMGDFKIYHGGCFLPENVFTRLHPQAFSELQLQNAELRRRLEDADLCKNNCNTSNSLPAQATQNCSRLEEKEDIDMSRPASYTGDPLKLDLEGVKLELEGVKLGVLDGSVKMIPEVMDDLLHHKSLLSSKG